MPGLPIQALSPLRHACLGCGGSCRGVQVSLVGDDEIQRIYRLARKLAVDTPIVDGALRQVDGSCVFLDESARCRLHARFGADSKPRVCRQYPTVVVHTEAGLRAGIDPGCFTAWRTWRDAPPIEVVAFVAGRADLDPRQAEYEARLLALLETPGVSIGRLLGALCAGGTDATGLPEGLAGRIVQRIQAADVAGLVSRPEAGSSLRQALRPLADAAPGWSPHSPPPWPVLEPDAEAWAVAVVRSTLYLRLLPNMPYVQGVALLTAIGAVACAWAGPRSDAFGPALAAWTRALRISAFARALVPDPATLLYLATGGADTQSA